MASDHQNPICGGSLNLLRDICCLSLLPSRITSQSTEPAVHQTPFKHQFVRWAEPWAHATSLWYQENFQRGLTVSMGWSALADGCQQRTVTVLDSITLLSAPLLGQNPLLTKTTFNPVVRPGVCAVGFASLREACPTQRETCCWKGSVMKADCNNCRLLHLHIWRLIHALQSNSQISRTWLFLKIDCLVQNKTREYGWNSKSPPDSSTTEPSMTNSKETRAYTTTVCWFFFLACNRNVWC